MEFIRKSREGNRETRVIERVRREKFRAAKSRLRTDKLLACSVQRAIASLDPWAS